MVGCANKDSVGNEGFKEVFAVVYNTIPYASGNMTWDEADLLEKDDYGRELYLYNILPDYLRVADDYSDELYYLHALVVCQTSNHENVFYYEDNCYLFLSDKEVAEEEIKKSRRRMIGERNWISVKWCQQKMPLKERSL